MMSPSQQEASGSRLEAASEASRRLLRRVATVALVLAIPLICLVLYWRYGDDLLQSEKYQLTWSDIQITPPPKWVRADAELFKQQAAGLLANTSDSGNKAEPLNLNDPQLTVRLAEAFRRHPWVYEVRRVVKQHPGKVTIDLEYRRPAAMVEVHIGGEYRLLPVDADGICLPTEDFTPEQAQSYPRVRDPGRPPATKEAGFAWGDERVVGAAQIAAALRSHWEELPLEAIIVPVPHAPRESASQDYLLETDDGRKIIWGRPPGEERAGEPLGPHKVAYLLQSFRPGDDQLRTLPDVIDLRVIDQISILPPQRR